MSDCQILQTDGDVVKVNGGLDVLLEVFLDFFCVAKEYEDISLLLCFTTSSYNILIVANRRVNSKNKVHFH